MFRSLNKEAYMFSFNPLWKTLIDKNMTKTQLRELIGISTATLSKLSKDEYVSMQVIDSICQVLQVKSISQVVEYVEENPESLPCDYLYTLENDVDNIINNKVYEEDIPYDAQKSLYDLNVKAINELINSPDKDRLDRYNKILVQYIDHKLLSGGHMLNLIQMLSLIDQNFK